MLLCQACPICRKIEPPEGCCCWPAPPDGLAVRTLDGIDLAVALHRYDRSMQQLVLAAKNGGRRDLVRRFGVHLAKGLAAHRSPTITDVVGPQPTVVWVPASRTGRRRRGYDQGRLLARSVGHSLRLPVVPLLARVGGHAQAGRSRTERLVGPPMRCRVRRAPSGVLIVDDVMTTGSSLVSAARALRAAGVSRVAAATVTWVD